MDINASVFDVAVIGGGPAGAACAICLARLGRTVIILERSSYAFPRIGETLAPSIKSQLSRLGLWISFVEMNPIPSLGIKSAWGGNDLTSKSFIFSPYGSGWHIDRLRFDVMLTKAAAMQGAVVLTQSQVTEFNSNAQNGWVIRLRDQNEDKHRSLLARSVVNGSGRSSITVQKLRARQMIYDNLVGAAVRFQSVHDPGGSYILIEAAEKGWWYSAPIPGDYFVVAFMTDADILVEHRLGQIRAWMKEFNNTEHTKTRCSEFTPVSGPRIFSAFSQRLRRCDYEDKWFAVGDAAFSVDPLSATGISFALRSGCEGAMAIDHWLSGDASRAKTYDVLLDGEFNQYLENSYYYYALETRWPDSLFWKRRSVLKRL